MPGWAASLLDGRRWEAERRAHYLWVVPCLPLLLLCAAWLAGAVQDAAWPGALTILRALVLAIGATLGCLALAIPPVLARVRPIWLLPLWLVQSWGALGWAWMQPLRGVVDVAAATCLGLPVMVVALSGLWAHLPAGVSRAAAAAGAPHSTRISIILTLALPGAARACLIVFLLCLGLIVTVNRIVAGA